MSNTFEAEPPNWLPAATHEMGAITALTLGQTNEPLTKSQLAHEVARLSDNQVEFSVTTPQQFCIQTLEKPAGITERAREPYRYRRDRLTEFGKEQGVSILGGVAYWSLENPEYTLQQVLGRSGAASTIDGISQTALRYQIYKNLINEDALAISDLTGLCNNSSRVSITVKQMEASGLLVVEKGAVKNQRTFKIERTEQPKSIKPFEDLAPERQLMLNALEKAADIRGKNGVWQIDEFLELAKKIDEDPERLKKLTGILLRNLTPYEQNNNPYISNVSGPKNKKDFRYTNISIEESAKEAITELISILDSHINEEPQAITQGRERADEIIEQPKHVAELIGKSRHNSASVNKDPNFSENLFVVIETSDAPLTAKAICESYSKNTGRDVALGTVRKALALMTKKEKINAEPESNTNSGIRPATLYRKVS